jgi:carboxyl-terminal processing protease
MVTRNLPFYLGLLSVIALAFGVGYISYPLLHAPPEPAAAQVEDASAADPASNPDMGLYWEAWHLLDRDFLGDKPDTTARTYGAIRGMVESFRDPYTFFVEPRPRELERDELRGKFGGIGANIEASDQGYILYPLSDQPAANAGIQDGDLLLLVDDVEITPQMPLDEVAALVRGPVGTEVTLVVRRNLPGESNPVELTVRITRTEFETPSMEWRLLEDASATMPIGYIKHTIYSERSAGEMQKAVEELTTSGAKGFILDLRGNPGGLVSAAVEIADMWLDEGLILIEQRADGTENPSAAQPGAIAEDVPIVIIVDRGSASASEIVAGALQDNRRALLIGEKTFGKGSVQLIHELQDQSSLHITNAQWLTPNRNEISQKGLTPDILVAAGADPLPDAITAVQRASLVQASATPHP